MNTKTNTTKSTSLKVKSGIKAGGMSLNHNQNLVAPAPKRSLKVKTSIRAGGVTINHNQTLVRG